MMLASLGQHRLCEWASTTKSWFGLCAFRPLPDLRKSSTFFSFLICCCGTGASARLTVSVSPRVAGPAEETTTSIPKPTGEVHFSNKCQLARPNPKWARSQGLIRGQAHLEVTELLAAVCISAASVSKRCVSSWAIHQTTRSWRWSDLLHSFSSHYSGCTAVARRSRLYQLLRSCRMSSSGVYGVCSSSVPGDSSDSRIGATHQNYGGRRALQPEDEMERQEHHPPVLPHKTNSREPRTGEQSTWGHEKRRRRKCRPHFEYPCEQEKGDAGRYSHAIWHRQ